MLKIDLKQSSGLPLIYTTDEIQPQGLKIKKIVSVSIDRMRSQLLNQELDCPALFYKKYKGIDKDDVFKNQGININMYLIYPNLAGIEYGKTLATRSRKYPRVFEIEYGAGIILLQRYDSPVRNRTIKIPVKKGQKVIIPQGYSCTITNTRQGNALIVLDISSIKAKPRIVLDGRRGMAYYIIRKNAKQEVVRNPEYKIANDPEKIDLEKVLSKFGITNKTPIVKQIMRKYEKFDWLFKDTIIDI